MAKPTTRRFLTPKLVAGLVAFHLVPSHAASTPRALAPVSLYYETAYSLDDGKAWSKNQRITDQSVDRRLGIWGLNYDIAS